MPAYISLGSNCGNSPANLENALEAISKLPGVQVLLASRIYKTEPQEDPNQPWFFNQAALLNTGLAPHELLAGLQKIETALGRVRDPQQRFGPRTIDLDLLYMDGIELNTPQLILPHPRMWQRAFVLAPLLDIAGKPLLEMAETALSELNYRLDNDKIYQNG